MQSSARQLRMAGTLWERAQKYGYHGDKSGFMNVILTQKTKQLHHIINFECC